MIEIKNIGKIDEYVYDISLDGTVVDALTFKVASNTDGFNFKLPNKFRYTKEKPYIGKGLNRDVKEGIEYDGLIADIMEFDDLFMRLKMGLGLDEICLATCNLSRKNYMDYLEDGKTKKVGNTIKSKKMPGYIEKFIDKACDLLLFGKGKEFIDTYYQFIDDIYNYRIPLKDIASKGKIKKTLEEYKNDCNVITKGGTKKSRQAWYELLLREENPYVEMGDTIYYINIGTKKGDSDVKRTTKYYQNTVDNGKVDITKDLNREFNKYKKQAKSLIEKINNNEAVSNEDKDKYLIYDNDKECYQLKYSKLEINGDNTKNIIGYIDSALCKDIFGEDKIYSEDEILLNCVLLDRKIVESEDDVYCDDSIEYNVVKYIEQFNNRIKPLLVCFSPEIRDSIIIKNPNDKRFFTEEETALTSGYPNKPTDQDTYEELMSMDRREVAFWTRVNKIPPFVKECGMDWDKIKEDYFYIKKQEDNELFKSLDEKYHKALDNLTESEIEEFIEEGEIPSSLQKLVYIKEDSSDLRFYFKDLPNMTPSSGGYIFDDISMDLIENKANMEYEKAIANNEDTID